MSVRLDAASAPVFESELRVRYAETDQMGVVYHSNYLVWCEVGRTDFIRSRGMPYSQMERDGVSLAVSDVVMRFLGAARYDDRIVVRTRLVDVRSRAIRFAYDIVNADTGRTLVTAETGLIALDQTGRPSTLPPAIRAMLDAAAVSA